MSQQPKAATIDKGRMRNLLSTLSPAELALVQQIAAELLLKKLEG